jgi:sulfhydrogenase subunit delta
MPQAVAYPVCTECKMHEQDCLLVARGIPCAGPITVAGCGARCPGYNVPCIGCRGPVDEANVRSWTSILEQRGLSEQDVRRRLRTFAGPNVGEESIGVA